MSAQPSIRIIHTNYRKGGTVHVGNRHHFTGSNLTGTTEFETLADAIVAQAKTILPTGLSITEAVAYDAGSDIPAHSKTYSVAGTFSTGTHDSLTPSDCAAVLRWSTTARSVKNHPVYLFSYVKPCLNDYNTNIELLGPTWKTALEAYGQAWIDGFSDGVNLRHRCGPNGAVAQDKFVDPYVSHRDFPR